MYGGYDDNLNGSGQGNRMGQALWALISSCLIKIMSNEGHVMTWQSALTLTVSALVCFAFVDDTNLAVSAPSVSSTGEALSDSAQKALDTWAQVLGASGGELDPKKSFCYLLDCKLDLATAQYQYWSKTDMPGDFYLLDNEGNRQIIDRYKPDVGKKTLGV